MFQPHQEDGVDQTGHGKMVENCVQRFTGEMGLQGSEEGRNMERQKLVHAEL